MSTDSVTSNERTFQGVLLNQINTLITSNDKISFNKILQEQNIGVGNARFADGLLDSSIDVTKKVLFELKDTNWDATDEVLVKHAMNKAFERGYEYFVTGTPRQLVIFKTFQPDTTIYDRKLKVYYLSNVKNNNEAVSDNYLKLITPPLTQFLIELSDIVHGVKEVQWDSIDKQFVNKLSAYILEASAEMFDVMHKKINSDSILKKEIKEYLQEQDIFNVSLNFNDEDIYNICQLANYLLYLKIIFYSYLQSEVPKLKLKKLEIPEDKDLLNKTLRERFDDVLKHDFEMIFHKSVLDKFEYSDKYIPALKQNVNQIRHLKFKELNVDIIGAIYNTLINNQEQHNRGQHFTNTNEVDIVNSFCINENTKIILDSGCGAGTFLVRGYKFLKYFHSELEHAELLEKLWGIEIAPFPAFLSTMNLSLLNIKEIDNYPVIIQKDFSHIKSNSSQFLIFHNHTKSFDVQKLDGKYNKVRMPAFDACIGNPPYIRQEYIEHKTVWNNLAEIEFGIDKINQQSDLYVYYLMHTAAFLNEGGRLGYVISSTWLDTGFGTGLQKFLLDHFKIVAVIDNQKVRSFETASVNTVILILEKCSNSEERELNNVRFVRVYKEYHELIGMNDDENRIEKVKHFVNKIESAKKSIKNEDYFIFLRNQKELEFETTINGKYENGNWGAKYLRSPEIYNKIIDAAGDKLIPANKVIEVKYGIKTGANEFFYVIDDTEKVHLMSEDEYNLNFGVKKEKHKINWEAFGWYYSEMNNRHYIMERRFFKPLFKTQKEAEKLEINFSKLKYRVLVCNETKASLRKYKSKILNYILDAESKEFQLHKRPSCAGRVSVDGKRDWFNLGEELFVGDFIFPSKIHEKYSLIDNREVNVFCDKVNYNIKVLPDYTKYADLIFISMNSILFRFFLELYARQMGEGLTDIDVNVVEKTMIINPVLLKPKEKELKKIFSSLRNREQESIFEEINKADRGELESVLFDVLGLVKNDVQIFLKEVSDYRKSRNEKASSVTTSKSKQTIDYDTSVKLIQDRFSEIHNYQNLIDSLKTTQFSIPNLPAKFPKDLKGGDSNFFNSYKVYFKDGNKETIINFESNSQIKLIKFFYDELEIKGMEINLPKSPEDCERIYKVLINDFNKYCSQIKSLLKTNRSKANYLGVYREIIF
ncbi:MAG: N-6 DNA methylase [Bacteroidetes bacterium]|nr:N-6 DNA methylase [Bacteroidota bacterium]